MFRLAVLGPIPGGGFGLVRQCTQCHPRRDGSGDPACRGFGAGCLGYRSSALAAATAGDFVRLDAKRLPRR